MNDIDKSPHQLRAELRQARIRINVLERQVAHLKASQALAEELAKTDSEGTLGYGD